LFNSKLNGRKLGFNNPLTGYNLTPSLNDKTSAVGRAVAATILQVHKTKLDFYLQLIQKRALKNLLLRNNSFLVQVKLSCEKTKEDKKPLHKNL